MSRFGNRSVLITATALTRPLSRKLGDFQPRWFDGWDELAAAVETAPPSTVALVDATLDAEPEGGPPARLREIIERRPSIAVVAVLPSADDAAGIHLLIEWGVTQVMGLRDARDALDLGERLRDARARSLKDAVKDLLPIGSTVYAQQLVHAACDVVVEAGGAPEMAERFGADPRTVAGWCTREALPPPRRLLAWTRVLLACMLLKEDGRSVVNSARGAGYATDHALRRALRQLVRADPVTAKRAELFDLAVDRFRAELRGLQDVARDRRRLRPARRAGAMDE
jgi:AraC-like DNA-binding protein